jgi:alginate O-acetyltransferase complex protein AlgJ
MDLEITGDLWRALGDSAVPKERLSLRRVGVATAAGLDPLPPDPGSPVVLLGDSHNLVFHAGDDMQTVGCGLPDQLALELGFAVDLVAVRGSGATPARINLFRRAQKEPAYWQGKKCVVWCFAAREFTESDGWRKAPIAP